MEPDDDVGGRDFMFGTTGLLFCALVAIVFAIVS
jgi:hypothetical protein